MEHLARIQPATPIAGIGPRNARGCRRVPASIRRGNEPRALAAPRCRHREAMKLQGAMQVALRKAYSERIVQPPFELCEVRTDLSAVDSDVRRSRAELFAGWPGLAEALDAARAGNIAQVDEIELFWLNAWGPRPTIEDVAHLVPDDHGPIGKLGLLAMEIQRGAGPRGETLVEWGIVLPCGRCWGRVKADPRCRFCGGRKHRSDAWAVIYTDIDSNVIEGMSK